MPHVTFITLSGFRICDPELRELGLTLPGFEQRSGALGALPALGLATLAAMLPNGWTCSYRAPIKVDAELIEGIASESPDLVAISALTASIDEAYVLSRALRQRHLTSVLGGLHVTACPAEALRYADAVVLGSGEPVWLNLLRDIATGQLQQTYDARSAGPMAEWPMPRFDLLGNVQRYTLQTQRGCPFNCEFCAASRLLERFREKPNETIQTELAAILQRNPRALIELADDNTFAGHRDWEPFFEIFQQSGVRWFTETDWRIGERPDILRRLAMSGCVQVLIGVESTVFRYPGMGRKQAELERIEDAVLAVQESGVAVNGCFIVGADGETPASLDHLTGYLLQAPFADLQVTLQTPFPGTELHRRLHREGRLLPDRGWPYYSLLDVTFRPDRMSVSELERGFREMIRNVHGPDATRRRRNLRLDAWRRNSRLRPKLGNRRADHSVNRPEIPCRES